MTILQAVNGTFFDVPDDKAASYEVPAETVSHLLDKSGPPARQGSPAPAAAPKAPVVVQIFAAPDTGSAAPPPSQPAQEETGDVNPYWWWRNITFYRPWFNGWGNWGNW